MRRLKGHFYVGFTGFVTVWLSGILLLFCCGAMPAKAESCPLARAGSHCDKSQKAESDNNTKHFSRSSVPSVNCCSFLPALYDKARKIQKNDSIESAELVEIAVPFESYFNKLSRITTKFAYHPRIFVTKKIFIRNCVFRI